jgi:RimJ/RimL family protein N-acetyltransferase
VLLREWTDDDVDAMAAGLDDPEIARWTRVPSPYTREHAADFIAAARAARASGERLVLAIAMAPGEPLIGSITLRFDWEPRRADLGNVLFAPHRGRGLGRLAGRLLAPYAFERLGVRRIEILADARNELSVRSSEAAGFKREGILRSYMERDGERIDMVAFSRLPDDVAG